MYLPLHAIWLAAELLYKSVRELFPAHMHAATVHTLTADILRVMPSKAIELAAFDAYKKLLSHEGDDGKLMRPGPLLTGLAGAAAGAMSFLFFWCDWPIVPQWLPA